MKLSVATYRASTERLTSLRQNTYGTGNPLAPTLNSSSLENRRGSSLDSGAALILDSFRELQEGGTRDTPTTSISLPKV